MALKWEPSLTSGKRKGGEFFPPDTPSPPFEIEPLATTANIFRYIHIRVHPSREGASLLQTPSPPCLPFCFTDVREGRKRGEGREYLFYNHSYILATIGI